VTLAVHCDHKRVSGMICVAGWGIQKGNAAMEPCCVGHATFPAVNHTSLREPRSLIPSAASGCPGTQSRPFKPWGLIRFVSLGL